jgi:glycerophosphoryl diester phosphodiesterase
MIYIIVLIVIVLLLRYIFYWKAKDLDYLYMDGPIYFGHRGERNVAPENSISSYRAAINHGLEAIELDVMVTKDNQLICSHNIDLERETTGHGFIDELTYEEISLFRAGKDFHENEQDEIPTLIEVVKTLPDNILLNIEIKTKAIFDLRATKLVAELIKEKKIKQQVLVSSFNPIAIRFFKFIVKGVPTGFIYEHAQHFKGVFIARSDCLHPYAEFIDDKLIHFCKRRRIRINSWTVNNPHARDWLIDREISGIITDNPKIASNV